MSLEQQINEDIKSAMLSKDREKLEALRAIKAALLLEKTKEGGVPGEIPETVELRLLQKLVKQRKEAADIYKAQNRLDLAEPEIFQAGIIEKYLPKGLSPEETEARVREIIARTGATSIKDMGKLMGVASKELAGQADNKAISELVKKLLS